MLRASKYLAISGFVLLGIIVSFRYLDVRAGLFNDHLLQSTKVLGTDYPLTLIDPIGERYTLDSPPNRIVSVTLGTDEILAGLVEPARVVGVTYLVDDIGLSNVLNHYSDRVTRVHGDVEEILSLEPDLVFVAAYTRAETVRLLLSAGIPVVRLTEYSSFENLESNIKLVAKLLGESERAARLTQNLNHRERSMQVATAHEHRPRVLYYSLHGYSTGEGSVIDEIIHSVGGYNVLRDTGIEGSQKISEELAIGLEPDIILMSGRGKDESFSPSKQLMERAAWQNVSAVKSSRVHDLKGTWVLSVSQFSWDGLNEISGLIKSSEGPTQ